jgi:electron transfer flavoprotein beta subunit
VTFADMEDQNECHYGLKGSPTQVERMFPPEKNTDKEMWIDSDEELATKIADKLNQLKLL